MSSVSYEATAGQTDFLITYDYISTAHLQVFIDGVETTAFTVGSDSIMVLDVGALDGEVVTIQRTTPTTGLLTNFASPSSVRSGEIRTGFRQLLFIAQEILSSSLLGLRKTVNELAWNAEGLPLSSLGTPVAGDDAATKTYVDNLAAAEGVLPEPLVADLGKGIRIRSDGGGPAYVIGPINGATATFKIPIQLTGVSGFNYGQLVPPLGLGAGLTGTWQSDASSRMPLEVEDTAGTPTYGTISLDGAGFDIVVPRGTFIIEAEGPMRSLTNTLSGVNNPTSAAAALMTTTGTVLDVRPIVYLGRSGGAGPTYQAQSYVRLSTTQTFGATTRLNLRLTGSTSSDDVIADTPWRVRLTEVVL